MKLRPTSVLRFVSCLLVLFLATTGCTTVQTYPGPQLSPDKVAIIKGATNYYVISVVGGNVLKVDGQTVSGDVIEMLPGKREVVVNLRITGPNETIYGIPQTFSFIAEAGHVYKVDGNWNRGNNQIWILDEQTKLIVAGSKPGAAAPIAQARTAPIGTDPVLYEACTQVHTEKFRKEGQNEKKAPIMAGLLCQIISGGCQKEPRGDPCKKSVREINDEITKTGQSLTYAAAYAGRLELIRILIEAGVDINRPVATGWTPLLIAAAEGHGGVVAALLEAGADPKATS